MKRSVRVAVGCLGILVVVVIFSIVIWWVPDEPAAQDAGETVPPAVR